MVDSIQAPVMATNKAGESVIFMRNRVCHIEASDAAEGCIIYMLDGKEMWCRGFEVKDFSSVMGCIVLASQIITGGSAK